MAPRISGRRSTALYRLKESKVLKNLYITAGYVIAAMRNGEGPRFHVEHLPAWPPVGSTWNIHV